MIDWNMIADFPYRPTSCLHYLEKGAAAAIGNAETAVTFVQFRGR
jgi:hypothetical protein